jgi:hypothetical protein
MEKKTKRIKEGTYKRPKEIQNILDAVEELRELLN